MSPSIFAAVSTDTVSRKRFTLRNTFSRIASRPRRVWNGERILPEGFVKFVSTLAPAWEADKRPIYGGFFWLNGDEAAEGRATTLADGDEVAVLPPVSGGIA